MKPLKVEVGRNSSIVDMEAVVAVRGWGATGTGVEVDACAGISRKTEWGQRRLKGIQSQLRIAKIALINGSPNTKL